MVGQRISGANYYFLVDGLGSVAKIIDSSGNVVRTYTYDAWGKTTVGAGTVDSAFRYAGGYFDPAGGLYKFGTRYYDPLIGRWTQQDPLPGSIANPSELNRYVYVANSPTNYADPTGLKIPIIDDALDAAKDLLDADRRVGEGLSNLGVKTIGRVFGVSLCVAVVAGVTGGVGTVVAPACAGVGFLAGETATGLRKIG